MTITFFISALILLGAIVDIFVEVIKGVLDSKGFKYNSVDLAIITSLVIGIIGGVIIFYTLSIPFTSINIVWLVLLVISVIIGSQIGYDKLGKKLFEIIKNFISPSK